MSMISGNWKVECTDRLTDLPYTVEVSKGQDINTQAKAEVMITTNPTPYGGKHPGFEVRPKDAVAYKAELHKWMDAHPDWTPPNLDDLTPEEAKALLKEAKAIV